MAEQPGAQSKLGELFVEFGSKGAPTLLKQLNGISATFLLTKNAATAAVKPITDISKKAAGNITSFDKFNAVTGLSIKQLQQLDIWAKLNNADFGNFIEQIHGLQQNLLDIQTGKGGNINGFALLGLDPRAMSYKKPLEALEQIRKRVQQVDEATGVYALRQLGLSEQLLYAWRQGNNQIDKRLLLNDKEISNLKELQTAWNKLGVTIENSQMKMIANSGVIKEVLKEIIPVINSVIKWTNKAFTGVLGVLLSANKLAGALGANYGENKAIKEEKKIEKDGKGLLQEKARYENMTLEQQKRYNEAMRNSRSYKEETKEQISLRQEQQILAALNDALSNTVQDLKNIDTLYSGHPIELDIKHTQSNDFLPSAVTNSLTSGNLSNVTVNFENKQYITTPDSQEAADLSGQKVSAVVQTTFTQRNQFGL